jgi:hypothetical protein
MSEKLTAADQTVLRGSLYEVVGEALQGAGFVTEPVSEGMLADVGDGQFVTVKVTYKNPEKFDLDAIRAEYAEKQEKQAERKALAEAKAKEKAEKAAAKAAKAAEAAE